MLFFLGPYHHATDTSKELTLAIEAVSLAYLWHQIYSDYVLTSARKSFVFALRRAIEVLKTTGIATRDTTLITSLLPNLLERITDSESRSNKSWTSHADGALTMVKLRGLDGFIDRS